MHVLREVSSRDARQQWREVLDTVHTGSGDVLISRHGQDVAVIIPAQDYYALADELEELRLSRIADSIYEDYLAGKESARPYEEARSEILEDN